MKTTNYAVYNGNLNVHVDFFTDDDFNAIRTIRKSCKFRENYVKEEKRVYARLDDAEVPNFLNILDNLKKSGEYLPPRCV